MITLKRVETEENANICYELSKLLVVSERKYDSNVKEDFELRNFYKDYYKDENYFLMLAFDNEIPIGFVSAYLREEAGEFVIDSTGVIGGLYVKTEYRSNGIATALLEETYQWCRNKNIKKIEISVYIENETAKRLYAKEGFVTSILRMTKNLD